MKSTRMVILVALLAGCSGGESETTRNDTDACSLVSEAEMSAILGVAVVAEALSEFKCAYQPASGISPSVELYVERGGGEARMIGVGIAGQHFPGVTNPYDGIGDQAVAIGPELMIRTGEDFVTITILGIDDDIAAARKIFDTAKARM